MWVVGESSGEQGVGWDLGAVLEPGVQIYGLLQPGLIDEGHDSACRAPKIGDQCRTLGESPGLSGCASVLYPVLA